MTRLTYRDAGVDIDAGDAFVDAIKPATKATARTGVMGGIGGFAALFDPKATGYRDPLIVSATDGVGTKLLPAIETDRLDGLGQDLVAMCVNDLICQGAEPMFFLDYMATGKLEGDQAARLVTSIARACEASGCALTGGETAEMPGLYSAGHFDLGGFAVGLVERDEIIPRFDDIGAGDVVWGWTSSGVHSNGFSLVRRVIEARGLSWTDLAPWDDSQTVADDLLAPTRLYVSDAKAALKQGAKAFAHITGGGLPGNLPRALPEGVSAELDASVWQRPAFMQWLADEDIVETDELYRVFNMGIGFCAIMPEGVVPEGAIPIGRLVASEGASQCRISG